MYVSGKISPEKSFECQRNEKHYVASCAWTSKETPLKFSRLKVSQWKQIFKIFQGKLTTSPSRMNGYPTSGLSLIYLPLIIMSQMCAAYLTISSCYFISIWKPCLVSYSRMTISKMLFNQFDLVWGCLKRLINQTNQEQFDPDGTRKKTTIQTTRSGWSQ